MGMTDDEMLELARQDRPISREELGIKYPSEEGYNILTEGILYDADKAIEIIKSATPIDATPKDQYEEQIKTNNRLVTDNKQLRATITMMRLDYEAKLKADKVDMLEQLDSEIQEQLAFIGDGEVTNGMKRADNLIKDKINALKQSIWQDNSNVKKE